MLQSVKVGDDGYFDYVNFVKNIKSGRAEWLAGLSLSLMIGLSTMKSSDAIYFTQADTIYNMQMI